MPISSSVTLIPWDLEAPPSEDAIRRILAAEGLQPYAWANSPGDVYSAHVHGYHKVIYALEGWITFGLPDEGKEITLKSGDRLELPAGLKHNAVVGSQGVLCLEAHLRV
jgi:quercetin dioxygenase-like cupin family protein